VVVLFGYDAATEAPVAKAESIKAIGSSNRGTLTDRGILLVGQKM